MARRDHRREGRKSNYIFTAKKHPEKGIMSAILGVISVVSILAAVYLSYQRAGNALPQYGTAVFLAFLFAVVGIGLGVKTRLEKDYYYLFPNLGIFLNLAAMMLTSLILYSGV